jgi:hypothetical protein
MLRHVVFDVYAQLIHLDMWSVFEDKLLSASCLDVMGVLEVAIWMKRGRK